MKKRAKAAPPPLPVMLMELSLASWETIARRSMLMAQGRCSAEEYARMVGEKARAAQATLEVMSSPPASLDAAAFAAMLAPWHRGASANARRLRRK